MQYQGGGVVRLFHRESECYVSAEGSFALSRLSADIEDGMYLSIYKLDTEAKGSTEFRILKTLI